MEKLEHNEMTQHLIEAALQSLEERLTQAKTRLQAEADETLGDILLPEFCSLIPSMSIAQIQPGSTPVPSGSELTSYADDEAILWQTIDAVDPWPWCVSNLTEANEVLRSSPQDRDRSALPAEIMQARSGVYFRLNSKDATSAHCPDAVSLYLHGSAEDVLPLFQAMTRDGLGCFARHQGGAWKRIQLQPTFLANGMEMIPSPATLPTGSRLLMELFSLPERFCFLQFSGLADLVSSSTTGDIEILVALKIAYPVSAQRVLLMPHCTPVINLFSRQLADMQLSCAQHEWPILPEGNCPIFSIDSAYKYDTTTNAWMHLHHHRLVPRKNGYSLTFVQPLFQPESSHSLYVRLHALCCHGAKAMKTGMELEYATGKGMLLGQPTQPIQPGRGSLTRWYTSGLTGPASADNLQRLLQQHAFLDSVELPDKQKLVQGIQFQDVSMNAHHSAGDTAENYLEVMVEMQEAAFPGKAWWLHAIVLSNFLARYSAMGQTTQLIFHQASKKEYYRCPRQSGLLARL